MNTPGQRRVPIAGIGRATPESMTPGTVVEQILGSSMATPNGPMMDPSIFEGAPPWVAMLANLVQNLRVEIAAQKLALIRRGLMTEAEFMEATLAITREYEQQFIRQTMALGERMNQQPRQPLDPRRPPT